jgi:hypothetical protein
MKEENFITRAHSTPAPQAAAFGNKKMREKWKEPGVQERSWMTYNVPDEALHKGTLLPMIFVPKRVSRQH